MAGLPPKQSNLKSCELRVIEVRLNDGHALMSLASADQTNKLGLQVIRELLGCVTSLREQAEAGAIERLIITGNNKFFSADLALACDYRIASPDAVFGHRGASLGLITGWGGTQRLPRLIGKPRALQMFLLAEMVKADEAKRIGLVDQISEDPIAAARNWQT